MIVAIVAEHPVLARGAVEGCSSEDLGPQVVVTSGHVQSCQATTKPSLSAVMVGECWWLVMVELTRNSSLALLPSAWKRRARSSGQHGSRRPGDHEAAIAQRRARGRVLVAGDGGVDEELVAGSAAIGVEQAGPHVVVTLARV